MLLADEVIHTLLSEQLQQSASSVNVLSGVNKQATVVVQHIPKAKASYKGAFTVLQRRSRACGQQSLLGDRARSVRLHR